MTAKDFVRPDSVTDGMSRLYYFERPGALMRYLDQVPNPAPGMAQSIQEDDGGWAGTPNIDEAKRLFIEGWPQGVVEMRGMVEDIERVLLDKIPRPTTHRDVYGSDVDISAYMEGDPECMVDWRIEPQTDQGIRIIVNGTFSAGISQRKIKARGAAIVAFLHALQMVDIPAELWGYWAVNNYDDAKHEVWVRISRPGYEIDIERVAFLLAHPSMLRRIVFAAWEREDQATRDRFGFRKDRGYGHVHNLGEDERSDGDLYLPGMIFSDKRWDSAESSVEWILEELGKHGVELIG